MSEDQEGGQGGFSGEMTYAMAASVISIALVVMVVLGPATIKESDSPMMIQNNQYLVGAVYYGWYPANFGQGWVRANLDPPQVPELGIYNSTNKNVIERHIQWASRYGIDFFALNWWPRRPLQNKFIADHFLKADNIGDVKFSIFYETQNVAFVGVRGLTLFHDKNIDFFVNDVLKLADQFFDHPGYLRVNDRPVIFFYLSRTFFGEYEKAFKKLRSELAKRGHNPYIIGDEIFWGVVPADDLGKPLTPEELANGNNWFFAKRPQPKRIQIFDAITAYNMYEGGSKSHKGYASKSQHIQDVNKIYGQYRKATGSNTAFVPNITPGYNDRGVRLGVDHYPIPRQYSKDGKGGSFFSQAFDQIAFPNIDPLLNMILVTSWNEWNEDTAIEPLAAGLSTSKDHSPDGSYYTSGVTYEAYGTKYLEVVRDKVVSVTGRITKVSAGVAGATVCVAGGGDIPVVECGRSDSRGYYRISRLNTPPGEYELTIEGVKTGRNVQIIPGKCATGEDFNIK